MCRLASVLKLSDGQRPVDRAGGGETGGVSGRAGPLRPGSRHRAGVHGRSVQGRLGACDGRPGSRRRQRHAPRKLAQQHLSASGTSRFRSVRCSDTREARYEWSERKPKW
jgi:hypothetical protein